MVSNWPKGRTWVFTWFLISQLFSTGKPLLWWLYTHTGILCCFKRSIVGDILLFVNILSANDFWLVNRLSVDDFWLLNWRGTRPNCQQIRPERLKSNHAWALVTLIISHNGWMLETMSKRRFFEKSGRGDIMRLTKGRPQWKKKRFLSAIARIWGGRLPMPEFFGPLSKSAFLVNKESLFLQKCQCIELLTVF